MVSKSKERDRLRNEAEEHLKIHREFKDHDRFVGTDMVDDTPSGKSEYKSNMLFINDIIAVYVDASKEWHGPKEGCTLYLTGEFNTGNVFSKMRLNLSLRDSVLYVPEIMEHCIKLISGKNTDGFMTVDRSLLRARSIRTLRLSDIRLYHEDWFSYGTSEAKYSYFVKANNGE